jgi:hypothetical protein
MSSTSIAPLHYDYSGVMLADTGLSAADLAGLRPRVEQARAEVLADEHLWRAGGPVPPDEQPLDAGFIGLPDRLLSEYRAGRDQSEIGQILAAARTLDAAADRVIVLGIGGSYMGARALFEGWCHPHYNDLSRAAVLSDDDARHGRLGPADRHQRARPAWRRSLQETHERIPTEMTPWPPRCAGWDTLAGWLPRPARRFSSTLS